MKFSKIFTLAALLGTIKAQWAFLSVAPEGVAGMKCDISFDKNGDRIQFDVIVNRNAYFGIGFAGFGGQMVGADLIIFKGTNGGEVEDLSGVQQGYSPGVQSDRQQDVVIDSVEETATSFLIKASRPMDTGEFGDQRFGIGEASIVPVIFAANTDTADLAYHTKRGNAGDFIIPAYSPEEDAATADATTDSAAPDGNRRGGNDDATTDAAVQDGNRRDGKDNATADAARGDGRADDSSDDDEMRNDMRIEGLGAFEEEDDEMKVTLDGWGTIQQMDSDDGKMTIMITMDATKAYLSVAAVAAGAAMTLY